jgi:hypothetical protein
MYVRVSTANGDQPVVWVLGETLKRHEEGYFFLPGRLIPALKPDDLPSGIGFSLDGPLPSGFGFYREDRVVFRRADQESCLWVEVKSTYHEAEWDGLFPLRATLLARQKILEEQPAFREIRCESEDGVSTIHYAFSSSIPPTCDLEQAVEAICDTVCEVEARGNMRLMYGDTWPSEHG